ncbi:hypothetical protein [Bradyrhizobium retamae]|uniref:hypothetical protein n=1 Tax=Bradyrhizobium retamae TaxID=1300035 RepID=UPI0012E38CEA|nr:hypothetical protein [Bradyrhizobium retamae]
MQIVSRDAPRFMQMHAHTPSAKISSENDKTVKPLQLAGVCDFFATQQRRSRVKTIHFRLQLGRSQHEYSPPVASSFGLSGKTHISTSERTRRPRFTGSENPVQLSQIGWTKPARIEGRRPS